MLSYLTFFLCVWYFFHAGPWGSWHHQGGYGNYGNYGYGYDQNYGYQGYDYNSSYNYGAPAPGYGAPNYGNTTGGYDYNSYSGYSGELISVFIYYFFKWWAWISIRERDWVIDIFKDFQNILSLNSLLLLSR